MMDIYNVTPSQHIMVLMNFKPLDKRFLDEEEKPDNISHLGLAILYTLLACFFNALGLILMKFSMETPNKKKVAEEVMKKSYSSRCIWWSGLIALFVGGATNVFSAAYGNVILMASSGSVTLLFNLLLSVLVLKETFTKWDGLSLFLICGGSLTCMLYSKNEQEMLSVEEINTRFRSTGSILFYNFGIFFLFFSVSSYKLIRRAVEESWKNVIESYEAIMPVSNNDIAISESSKAKSDEENDIKLKNKIAILMCLSKEQKNAIKITGVSNSRLKAPLVLLNLGAGLQLSFTMTFMKGFTSLFEAQGLEGFSTWWFLLVTICSAFLQLKYLNTSMEIYD
jgi:uncharacterized membrane protein